MKFTSISVLLLMASTFVGAVASSATAQAEENIQTAPWKFHADVYGWLPDAPATVSYEDESVVEVPEDLDTILDSADALAMFALRAEKGRLILFSDVIYYKGHYDDRFKGPVTGLDRKLTLEEEVTFINYRAGYTFGPWDQGANNLSTVTLTPWVGGAYFHDNWSVKVKPKDAPLGGKVSNTFEFNTAMVGLSARSRLAQDWGLLLSYGYGGWGIDDVDEIYDAMGLVNYQFKMGDVTTRTYAGYRYYRIDWEDEPLGLRLTVKGPLIGIGWEF